MPFVTVSPKDLQKIKGVAENLHKIFFNTAKYVLSKPELHKRFNVSKFEWEQCGKSIQKASDNYFYGRMDIGFSLDFSKMKIFEYNTGLCGEIIDTTSYAERVFNHYVLKNTEYNKALPESITKSTPSGFDLLNKMNERWYHLTSNGTKTLYVICTKSEEEHLVINSWLAALDKGKHKIPYKKVVYGKDIEINPSDGCLYDMKTKEKVEVMYKAYTWYEIFGELLNNPKHKKIFDYFLIDSDKCKVVEAMWKTIMGNKALLPYVYSLNKGCDNILPTSFNPKDECFDGEEYLIEKGLRGRGSMLTKRVKREDVIKNPKKNVIYQQMFKNNRIDDHFLIMGAWMVGEKFSGMWMKKSDKMINDYYLNVIPARILNDGTPINKLL